ncbi:Uncharacterised protein [Mycobacteroides abscessus subsp. abscessus]|nr:Uncharacterised protein [Mycobacteroides abscessus subsp. abscessus]
MSYLKRLKTMPYKLPMKLRLRVAFQSLKSSVKVWLPTKLNGWQASSTVQVTSF